MKNNNNFIQKRESEDVIRKQKKESAATAHYKEVQKAIRDCAKEITLQYGLSEATCKKIIALVYEDKDAAAELPLRISHVMGILEKYGYTKEEASSIIDSNFSLIRQKPLDLIHNLAIANQYGFDEELLINNSNYSNINEKEMYAIIEELKANGIEPALENVKQLNETLKADKKMSKVIELHPLARKTILVYRTLYDRNMNSKVLTKRK